MKILSFLFVSATLLFASSQEALDAYKNHEYKKAFKLYKEAADLGKSNAQSAVSYLYINGIGVEKNTKEGIAYLQKAANNGNVQAALDLGLYYLSGEIVSKDMKKAAKWLDVAAKGGSSEAAYNLALMYYNGDGVKQDVKKAAALLDQAARAGHKGAKRNVGRIYMQALDFKNAKYWLRENEKDGDKEATLLLKEIEAAHKE